MRSQKSPAPVRNAAAWAMDLLWMLVLATVAVPQKWALVAILMAMGYLFHRLLRGSIWTSLLVVLVLSGVGYGVQPGVLTIALVVLGALWGFIAEIEPPQRILMWVLIITMAEAMYRASDWWVPWFAAALGLLGLAIQSPEAGIGTRVHALVASLTGLSALLIAAAVTAILWLIPWVWIVQNTVGRLAAGLVSLIPLLHVHPHPAAKTKATKGHIPKALHVVNHTEPIIAGVLLALLVVGLVWILWRLLREVEAEPGADAKEESFIIREHLAGQEPFSGLFRRRLLTPVRQLTYRRLRHSFGKPQARKPGETLRQWARRIYGKEFNAIIVYEEVRYGEVPDTESLARDAEKNWSQQNVIE